MWIVLDGLAYSVALYVSPDWSAACQAYPISSTVDGTLSDTNKNKLVLIYFWSKVEILINYCFHRFSLAFVYLLTKSNIKLNWFLWSPLMYAFDLWRKCFVKEFVLFIYYIIYFFKKNWGRKVLDLGSKGLGVEMSRKYGWGRNVLGSKSPATLFHCGFLIVDYSPLAKQNIGAMIRRKLESTVLDFYLAVSHGSYCNS